jgi:hypothetical protein
VKPDRENIRDLNLAVVKLRTVQATRLTDMICPAKSVLRENFFEMQKEEFSRTWYICAKCTLDERPSTFIADKPIFLSERLLLKDYYCKGSIERKILWSWISRNLRPRRTDWR